MYVDYVAASLAPPSALGLTADEDAELRAHQERLAEKDWIQRYTRWASSRTDASPNFHPVMGHTMIATVINRKRWFPSQHKDYFPNLLTMLLAQSGKRKSVALSYPEHDILPVAAPNLILPNEVTPEGLLDILSSEPSGVMFMDEAGSFFNLCKDRAYGSRLREIIPKLYDCPPQFRRKLSQRWVSCKDIYLNQALAIAWENFTENYLQPAWITSGFLPRYFPILGRTIERKPIRRRHGSVDTVRAELAEELKQLRERLAEPRSMEITDAALDRLEAFQAALEEWAEKQFRSDLAMPYATRLQDYSVKFSITSAVSQDEDKRIDLPHVLQGIQQTEEGRHAVEALIEEASSSAVRKLDMKTLRYVQKNPGATTREVQRGAGFANVYTAEASLKRLEAEGSLRSEPGVRNDSVKWFPVESAS